MQNVRSSVFLYFFPIFPTRAAVIYIHLAVTGVTLSRSEYIDILEYCHAPLKWNEKHRKRTAEHHYDKKHGKSHTHNQHTHRYERRTKIMLCTIFLLLSLLVLLTSRISIDDDREVRPCVYLRERLSTVKSKQASEKKQQNSLIFSRISFWFHFDTFYIYLVLVRCGAEVRVSLRCVGFACISIYLLAMLITHGDFVGICLFRLSSVSQPAAHRLGNSRVYQESFVLFRRDKTDTAIFVCASLSNGIQWDEEEPVCHWLDCRLCRGRRRERVRIEERKIKCVCVCLFFVCFTVFRSYIFDCTTTATSSYESANLQREITYVYRVVNTGIIRLLR